MRPEATTSYRRLLAALLVLTATMLLGPVATARSDAQEVVDGQLIARFTSAASARSAPSGIRDAGGRVVRRLTTIDALVIRARDGVEPSRLRRVLERRRDIRYVEPDVVVRKTKTPDDPSLFRQYALGAGPGTISAPPAWERRTACAKVAVLDSGVQFSHPDLKANIWHNSGETKANGKDDDHNGYIDDYYGVDIAKGRDSATDDDGHGTHVAGIIGGRGDNAIGITGACWSATVMPIRFLDERGRGSTSDAIAGLAYAVAKGAKVVNCSFGSSSASAALEDAIDDARRAGVLLVVAAGNDGASLESSRTYPASFPAANIVSVAATTASDALADFSNYGSKSVDLAAPGDGVFSTYPDSGYRTLSGTSMAAPFVAAAAAMLRAQDPDASYSQIRSALLASVDEVPSLSGRTVTGGRLDLQRALGQLP